MAITAPSARTIILKTVVAHTATYFVMGLLAFVLFDSAPVCGHRTQAPHAPDDRADRHGGPLFQPLRGLIFGVAFVLLRRSWLEQENGWLRMWAVLIGLGILGTFGPWPGSIEGMVYTTLPIRLHLIGAPEVVLQSLLLSVAVFYWVRHPEKRWLRWLLGTIFCLALLLPALGLLVEQTS